MAKLGARGRREIFRVSKESAVEPPQHGVFWRKHVVALMSDGSILERDAWRAKDPYRGAVSESGTWKVAGKIKPGLTVGDALAIYEKKGYRVDEAVSRNGTVLRTEKKAEKEKVARKKGAEKRAKEQAEKHGPGFYVRNRTTTATPWATNYGPFSSAEEALERAWRSYQEYLEMGFDYLLPVQIAEAPSRQAAEWGFDGVHVWWTNGKWKGPPVDPRQLRFPSINGS